MSNRADETIADAGTPSHAFVQGSEGGEAFGQPARQESRECLDFPNLKNNDVEKTIHPCQFPVELVERLVLLLTDAGGAVLDPYMGVGTTVIGAAKHGRAGYGCDIVQEYVDIACQGLRLLEAGDPRTRPMHKPVYDPSLPYGGHR